MMKTTSDIIKTRSEEISTTSVTFLRETDVVLRYSFTLKIESL